MADIWAGTLEEEMRSWNQGANISGVHFYSRIRISFSSLVIPLKASLVGTNKVQSPGCVRSSFKSAASSRLRKMLSRKDIWTYVYFIRFNLGKPTHHAWNRVESLYVEAWENGSYVFICFKCNLLLKVYHGEII